MNRRSRGGDGHTRVDATASGISSTIREDLYHADFHDAVGLGIGARRFQIDDNQRTSQSQILEHGKSRQ
jgi:hypothetical protein